MPFKALLACGAVTKVQILEQIRGRRTEGLNIGAVQAVGSANAFKGARNRVAGRKAQAGLGLVVILHKRLLRGIEILALPVNESGFLKALY